MNEYGGFQLLPTGSLVLGFDLEFTFELSQTIIAVNGSTAITTANPGFTEFTSLFQQYCIEAVEIQVLFDSNTESLANSGDSLPVMVVAVDYRDANSTTVSTLLQYENVRVIQLGNLRNQDGQVFMLKPRAQKLVYSGVSSSYEVAPANSYYSTEYPSIPHYGIKLVYDPVIQSGASNIIGHISFYVKYHLSFKQSI
jgi:hypothetical protein